MEKVIEVTILLRTAELGEHSFLLGFALSVTFRDILVEENDFKESIELMLRLSNLFLHETVFGVGRFVKDLSESSIFAKDFSE
jgi:hypothetical protein